MVNILEIGYIVLIVLIVFIIVSIGLLIYKSYLKKVLDHEQNRVDTVMSIVKGIAYGISTIWALIYVMYKIGIPIAGLITSLGAFSVIIGLILQPFIINIIYGIFIIFDNTFKIGDVIKVNDIEGKVIKISLRNTVVKLSDNTIVTIYNSKLDIISNKSNKK